MTVEAVKRWWVDAVLDVVFPCPVQFDILSIVGAIRGDHGHEADDGEEVEPVEDLAVLWVDAHQPPGTGITDSIPFLVDKPLTDLLTQVLVLVGQHQPEEAPYSDAGAHKEE